MFGPRWNKVFRELWRDRSRSILVILSIAVGVAAIGAVAGTQRTLASALPAAYEAIQPSSINLLTDPFDEMLIDQMRRIPGVVAAEGRFQLSARCSPDGVLWKTIQLTTYPDFQHIQVNKIRPAAGQWPPPDREILIERASLELIGRNVGDTLTIQLPDGTTRSLPIAGLVHDLNQPAGAFSNQVSGYITVNTLEWLGYEPAFNELLIAVKNTGRPVVDRKNANGLAKQARLEVEDTGRRAYWTIVQDPGLHWFQPMLAPMVAVLSALGGVALILSGFLVINTVAALLAQQTRQIGMMKAVGGRTLQISVMYTGMVLVFGMLALAVAAPLGVYGARAFLYVAAAFINFDPPVYHLARDIFVQQAALSLLLPVLAALVPIGQAVRISVRKALDSNSSHATAGRVGLFERASARFHVLPHPLMLSLRNTFRRKTRLGLTLLTLALGSAIFIAVQNAQSALLATLDDTLRYYNFDLVVFFDRPYRAEQLKAGAKEVPVVTAVETWGVADAHRIRADGSEGDGIMFVAPPANTQMVEPVIVAGRWLVPEDENALVVNTDLLRLEPDIAVGKDIKLKIEGKTSYWRVVGVVQSVLMGPWAYTNQSYFAYQFNRVGQASAAYMTITHQGNPRERTHAVSQIEDHFQQLGLRVSSIATVADLRQATTVQFQVITGFLMVMAILIAIVGGMGLAGTMSLNVIERSREIGMMRAIGARNAMIHGIVISEGMFIGFLSWLGGVLVALPFTRILNNLIGMGFLQAELPTLFYTNGAIIWLGVMLALSAAASLAPAHRATRISIREVLAYE